MTTVNDKEIIPKLNKLINKYTDTIDKSYMYKSCIGCELI